MKKRNLIPILFSIVLLPVFLMASDLNTIIDKKIAPEFKSLIAKSNNQFLNLKQISGNRSSVEQKGDYFRAVIRIDDAEAIKKTNMNINSVINEFATATLTLDDMIELAQKSYVKYIYSGEIYYPTNDVATALLGADLLHNGYLQNEKYNGEGVIVLIIDTGIDWKHLDFRDLSDTTKSRILYIWDQTLTKSGSEETPQDRDAVNFSGLNYGVEYTKTHINNEIDGSPANFVREQDTNGHGTHVSGSAAGNGAALSNKKYAGIANKADIVFVKAGDGSFSTANLIDALTYAKQISETESKPLVVNMSLGGHANAHDGTRDLDRAVDGFTSSASGRVAVISAGNEGDNSIHISGTLSAADSTDIQISVPSFTNTTGAQNDYFGFDLWWANNGDITATAISPNSFKIVRLAGTSIDSETTDGSIYLYNNTDASHTNGDRRNYLYVYDKTDGVGPATGTWTLRIKNNTAASMIYHGWLFGSSMNATLSGGNSNYTVGSPGTATSAITVASYVSRWRWFTSSGSGYAYSGSDYSDDISSFGSIGPRRDGVQKPDITAPGQAIISTLSSSTSPSSTYIVPGDKHRIMQGTSMSSPICAGAVALLLDYDPTLTASQVKNRLTSYAETDNYTGSVPNYTWGYGKLNIFKSLAKSINSGAVVDQNIFIYDTWAGDASVSIGAGVKIAVKFSPSDSGDVSGVFFHPSTTVDFSDSLYAEIWTDSNNLPKEKIGSTVKISVNDILPYSWNYINMNGTDVSVSADSNYHAVLYFPTGSNMYIRYDDGAVDNRSSYNSSGSWNSYNSGDFRIRAVVSTSEEYLDHSLPVELVSFASTYKNGILTINWATESEMDNLGFMLERRKSKDTKWIKIADYKSSPELIGQGTVPYRMEYNYLDRNVDIGQSYDYRLSYVSLQGIVTIHPYILKDVKIAPYKFVLNQNYPNPFNPSTVISYQLAENCHTKLYIYNILGQKIRMLINKKQKAGKYRITFKAKNIAGGIYFYRLEAGNYKQTKKMIIIR